MCISVAFNNDATIEKTLGETITCVSNTSQLCNYTWKHVDEENEFEEYNNQVLNTANPGRYMCKAECKIRDGNCTVQAMEVEIHSRQCKQLIGFTISTVFQFCSFRL